jgi:capsid protein
MAEARRTIDGDVFLLKRADGRLQAIEADRIRQPGSTELLRHPEARATGLKADDMPSGIATDDDGRPIWYALHDRSGNGFTFARLLPARDVLHHAYYSTERFDQTRGVSPLATALQPLQDLYEGFTYALAKAKVAQLFGMVVKRDSNSLLGELVAQDTTATPPKYDVDLGTKGPFFLDMFPGDEAQFLENKTPSSEFKDFTQAMIAVALKSLDIPFSFYDEAYTNFFGSRAALLLYQKSAQAKQADNRDLLTALSRWRLGLWVLDGTLALPPGIRLADITLDWIPAGTPWWNPAQEIAGDVKALEAGLTTRTQIRREKYGDDWRDVIDRLAAENDYMRAKGLSPTATADPPPTDDEDNTK